MRTTKHLVLAAMAAAALALASCGGGGGGSSTSTGPATPTTPQPPPKTALSYANDLNASVEAMMTLAAAETEAGSALMMAMKYSAMIGTLASDGNSMAAMNSAAAVLKAKSDLMAVIEAAKVDKMEAEEAKAGLPADADPAVVQALDDAIMAAETQIEAAEEVLNGGDLTGYVEMVTGTDEDDVKTAADRGEDVAMAIAMALVPMSSTDGAGTRVTHGAADPAATIPMANQFSVNDATGMTWAMIVGEDNVMSERIGTGNAVRIVASVAGMTAADIDDDVTVTDGTGGGNEYADAFTSDNSSYKGIPGDIFCLGSDCEVDANGKLAGSWYFSPASETTTYTRGDDGMYSPETLYATYGHWLVTEDHDGDAATPDVARVNTFAMVDGSPDRGSWAAADPSSTDAGLRAVSATYNGMAAGRSVHKTLDSNGAITDIQSGRFTASVMLTAEFGTSPMLGGTVSNFTSPDNSSAVDSSWTVELMKTESPGGEVDASTDGTTGGIAKATGQNGTWSATSYGASGMRPTGIYGGFNAHFTDGHVAGAYATRKD